MLIGVLHVGAADRYCPRPPILWVSESCLQIFGTAPWKEDRPFATPVSTQDNTNTERTHTYTNTPLGIGTYDIGVRAEYEMYLTNIYVLLLFLLLLLFVVEFVRR